MKTATKKKAAKADYKRNYLPPPNECSEEQLAAHRAKVKELSEKWRNEQKAG